MPSSPQRMPLPTQLPRARRHVPHRLHSSDTEAPNPFETEHGTCRKLRFPSPTVPASKGRQIRLCNVVVFHLDPVSCSHAPSPELPGLSHSWGELSQSGAGGCIGPLLPWDGVRCACEQQPQLESPSRLSMAPFLGAAAAKRRQIRKTEV